MNSFVKKLKREEKIKITEPSQEICSAYLEKSEKSLISAKTLTNIGHYDDAVALTYYSMYYCSLALLYKTGIKSENHSATIILLKEFFKINNEKIQEAKKERVDKQYYTDVKATKKDVKQGIVIAEEFNTEIREKLATMKQTETQKIQEKIKQLWIL